MEAEEQDIYEQSISDAPAPVEEPVAEAPVVEETSEAKAERIRDEKGRFAAADLHQENVVAEKPTEEARVPSWRLAEEADRRREAERSLQELKDEFRNMQLQMMQSQRPQTQEAPQEVPDIFVDPQGFVNNLQSNFDNRLKALQLEQSLRFAHYTHGEKFQEAYNNFTDHVTKTRDQASYQRIMASSDPGEALVQWHKERSLQKELGGSDLQSFMAKRQEEWLKDPAVQAKVIEAFKATQQAQAPSNTLTNLPPSLSRAASARSSHDAQPFSGADMYALATKK